jgi:hypothetical protein
MIAVGLLVTSPALSYWASGNQLHNQCRSQGVEEQAICAATVSGAVEHAAKPKRRPTRALAIH